MRRRLHPRLCAVSQSSLVTTGRQPEQDDASGPARCGEHRTEPRSTPFDGEKATLRWVIVHLIGENARHNGHLDLLREMADGTTGE
ncbi:MAG: DUF664 domain-containing protein [Nocardioidaceae bacterium]|nr:DUF664 domain-containing protein [Nocardioidaceae bacterium]